MTIQDLLDQLRQVPASQRNEIVVDQYGNEIEKILSCMIGPDATKNASRRVTILTPNKPSLISKGGY